MKRSRDGDPPAHQRAAPAPQAPLEPRAAAPPRAPLPPLPKHPFATDYNDHFETPLQAVADLLPALDALCAHLGRSRATLRVWDPFFCAGGMARHLAKLGFAAAIHRNEDFYGVIAARGAPPFDVLLTNPPYSGDHKARVLDFAVSTGKPFFLLLPAYCAGRAWWGARAAAAAPFFAAPPRAYHFEHPQGTGKGAPLFESLWYASAGAGGFPLRERWAAALPPPPAPRLRLLDSVEQLADAKLVAKGKRGNPRQRAKARQRAMEGAGGGGGGGGARG
jgi:hypothetical protein